MPWRGCNGWHLKFDGFAERFFDVLQLLYADGRMVAGLFEGKPQPKAVPDEAHDAVEVEGSLPTDPARQNTRHGHANDDASVGSAESHRRQSGSLKRRRPETPDTVTRWIRHALKTI